MIFVTTFPLAGLIFTAVALFIGLIFGGRWASQLGLSQADDTFKPTASSNFPYRSTALLSAWERRALLSIRGQIPVGFYVCPQVRLADRMCVDGDNKTVRSRTLANVVSKSVDFAVLQITTGNVVLVVELDDQSHHRPERRDRDTFVNSVLERSDVPVRRFRPDMPLKVADFFESARSTN